MGQGATTATLGAQTAGNVGNLLMSGAQGRAGTLMMGAAGQTNALMAAGTARASGYAGVANALTGGAQNWMLYRLLKGQGG